MCRFQPSAMKTMVWDPVWCMPVPSSGMENLFPELLAEIPHVLTSPKVSSQEILTKGHRVFSDQ